MIYKPWRNLDFGKAIEYLKEGKLLSRSGWNGKNMVIWLKPEFEIHADFCKDPILKKLVEENGGTMTGLPTICMKTADNKILTGWVASQSDTMANDWFVVD